MIHWEVGDIIKETIRLKGMEDEPLTNIYLVLDCERRDCYLVHNLLQDMTYKLLPLEVGTTYEKVG